MGVLWVLHGTAPSTVPSTVPCAQVKILGVRIRDGFICRRVKTDSLSLQFAFSLSLPVSLSVQVCAGCMGVFVCGVNMKGTEDARYLQAV